MVVVVGGHGSRLPFPRQPAGVQSTSPSTSSTPPGRAEEDGAAVVEVVEGGPVTAGVEPGPGGAGVVGSSAGFGGVTAGEPGRDVVAVVTLDAVVGVAPPEEGFRSVGRGPLGGEGGRVAGAPLLLSRAAGDAGEDRPNGMAVGGGSASLRPAPVRTPTKNNSEAPRTAAAAFTGGQPSRCQSGGHARAPGVLGRRLDRRREAVADPPHRVDPAGTELAAQRGDVHLDHV